jgi:hypothetical protein
MTWKGQADVENIPPCIVIVWCNIPSWQSCVGQCFHGLHNIAPPRLLHTCMVPFQATTALHKLYYPDLQGIIFPRFIAFWISLCISILKGSMFFLIYKALYSPGLQGSTFHWFMKFYNPLVYKALYSPVLQGSMFLLIYKALYSLVYKAPHSPDLWSSIIPWFTRLSIPLFYKALCFS